MVELNEGERSAFARSALALWVAAHLALYALHASRNQYRLSETFQRRLELLGWSEADAGWPRDKAVRLMKAALRAFPGTVSEMVHDLTSQHANLFKAFMVTAGLLQLNVDYDLMVPRTPEWERIPLSISVANVCRTLVQTVCMFAFPLLPVWSQYFALTRAHCKTWPAVSQVPSDFRAYVKSNLLFSKLHVVFAMPLLFLVPAVETYAALRALHYIQFNIRAADVLNDFSATVWLALASLRLLVGLTSLLSFFTTAPLIATSVVYQGRQSIRSFWCEFNTVVCLAYAMILSPLVAVFDPTLQVFHNVSPAMQAVLLAVTAHNGWLVLKGTYFCFFFALRARKPVDPFTDDQYYQSFLNWQKTFRNAEAAVDKELQDWFAAKDKVMTVDGYEEDRELLKRVEDDEIALAGLAGAATGKGPEPTSRRQTTTDKTRASTTRGRARSKTPATT